MLTTEMFVCKKLWTQNNENGKWSNKKSSRLTLKVKGSCWYCDFLEWLDNADIHEQTFVPRLFFFSLILFLSFKASCTFRLG